MEEIEMAVRCYPEQVTKTQYKGGDDEPYGELPSRVLVFDTETTVDRYQNLLFGSFQIYEQGELRYQGIFYGDIVSPKDVETLKEYGKAHNIPVISVREFVDKVFLPEIYEAHTLCVGFNLPFDISRLAIKFGNARGSNSGGFSFQLSKNKKYPRIIIKHLDSKRAFIKFANGLSERLGNNRHRKGHPNTFRGYFLDLRTLVFTLTNESHSLESACKLFKADFGKTHPEGHGKVSPEYIEYNLNDVRATYSLFVKLKDEYERYHLGKMPTKLYSPASIGKAYFEEMGIKSFMEKNPDFPKDILGYLMTTYYGGRSEVKVRKTPMLVNLIDFLSMYPTMCIIQGLWQFVICDHVDHFNDTENVRKFLETTNLETLSRPEAWQELTAIVQIVPDSDILPVRSKYGDKHTYNIGVNYLTGDNPVWYTLADILASKLLTGKTPNILRAIRFIPRGIQNDLQSVKIVGDRTINPIKEDFFKALMEYRNEVKKKRDTVKDIDPQEYDRLDSIQNIIKIITNSTSYGIFVEINTIKSNNAEVTVYGNGPEKFIDRKDKIEVFGREFNPLIATFITSASRLVLAITESILAKHGAVYAFCDTDSMAIPPEYVKEVQDYFQNLTPYSFPDPLFKLEKENYGPDGKLQPLWFYGISPKRYVLYNLLNNEKTGEFSISIRKASSHGLGHLLNPFKSTQRDRKLSYKALGSSSESSETSKSSWESEIWLDILKYHYRLTTIEDLTAKYEDRYAISKMAITSPHILKRFKKLNRGKSIHLQIKPFNFMLVGVAHITGPNGQLVKPIAPYSKDPQRIVYDDFIDYHSGETLNGIEYWKPFENVFWNYLNHTESKFDGDKGILTRKHLVVKRIVHIGKESNNLEETEHLGVWDDAYQSYLGDLGKFAKREDLEAFILNLKPQMAKRFEIPERTLKHWKKQIRDGKKYWLSKSNRFKLNRIFRKKI